MIRRSLTLVALTCVALLATGCGSKSEYPSRPITLVVPWGAGGGTDAIARMVAGLMEKELGKPVNVVNRTGGNGVVGHQAVAGAAPDGYTLGLITSEIAMMHWQGLTELSPADYTPLALINTDPAGIQVRADSPYRTLADLLAAIRASPGQVKASGCGQGCIWHVALAGLLGSAGVPAASVPWVPSNGAAPGLLDLVAGGIDVVPCSLPEARSLIDAGKVRSLAVMDTRRASLFPDVPTVSEAVGSEWTLAAWRGVAAPKGLPPAIAERLGTALKKAHDSQAFRDFMESRGFGVAWGDADQFAAHLAKADAAMGETIRAIGLAAK
jgi:tripartite-type tricarboxylate transporter receptor subunit TctC